MMNRQINIAIEILMKEEGYRESAYYCSEGYPTIGIGQRIGSKNHRLDAYQFQCSLPIAKAWLKETVRDLNQKLAQYSFYTECNPERQAVLISMAYQLGLSDLLKFENMLAAIENYDWQDAHDQGLDLRWAKQTPERANRYMAVLLSGITKGEYSIELND